MSNNARATGEGASSSAPGEQASIRVRMRMPEGVDVGPLGFDKSARIHALKVAALAEMQQKGVATTATSPKSLVIIHAGKVADDALTLSGATRRARGGAR